MTEAHLFVNILICQIDTAHISYITVNNHHLAVVPVIEIGIERWYKAVKTHRTYAERREKAVIIGGQGRNRANVVVDHAHIYALSHFPLQNFKDCVPHHTFFNDEIFKKDKFLRLPQFFAHRGKHLFAHAEIPGLRIGPRRHAIEGIDISGARSVARILLRQFLRSRGTQVIGKLLGGRLIFMLRARTVERRIAPQQIKQAAKQGQHQNNNDPGDFIGRIVIFTHQPDHNGKAEYVQEIRQPAPVIADPSKAIHHCHQLHNQEEAADDTAVSKQAAKKSAHSRLLSADSFTYIMISHQLVKVNVNALPCFKFCDKIREKCKTTDWRKRYYAPYACSGRRTVGPHRPTSLRHVAAVSRLVHAAAGQ